MFGLHQHIIYGCCILQHIRMISGTAFASMAHRNAHANSATERVGSQRARGFMVWISRTGQTTPRNPANQSALASGKTTHRCARTRRSGREYPSRRDCKYIRRSARSAATVGESSMPGFQPGWAAKVPMGTCTKCVCHARRLRCHRGRSGRTA